MTLLQTLKSLIKQRLSVAAEEIFVVVERILTEYDEDEDRFFCSKRHVESHQRLHRADLPLLDVSTEREEGGPGLVVQEEPEPPQIEEGQEEEEEEEEEERLQSPEEADMSTSTLLHRRAREDALSDFLQFPVCKEEGYPEQQERSPDLIHEEPEPPQIKEEQEELLQRPEEADGSTLTLITMKREEDDVNRETEPLASTSTEHMRTQADVEDCGTSLRTGDVQLLSSQNSEFDTDSDEWEETREDQSAFTILKSHKTQKVERERLPLSQDLNSSEQAHSTSCHTVNTHFTCTVCDKTFNRKGNLKTHMIIHTGEKLFCCIVCGKACVHNSQLEKHMRTHTGERPFSCVVCGKSFNRKEYLKTHMRIHTGERPFFCAVCLKSFNRKENLIAHMRTHTGEKPVSCTVCGRGFGNNSQLEKHKRTHTGEKPFSCILCEQKFGRNDSLRRHMRVHIVDESV